MSFDHAAFVSGLKARFPELTEELEEETGAGLLHVETGCFAQYAQAAVDRGDRVVVERCWAFANVVFCDCTPDVENALYVSFLEHLDFVDQSTKRRWALELMPETLRKGWHEMQRYLDDLLSKSKELGSSVEAAKKGPKASR
jgi:hypothetical protein